MYKTILTAVVMCLGHIGLAQFSNPDGNNDIHYNAGKVGVGTASGDLKDLFTVKGGNINIGNITNQEYSVVFRPHDKSWRSGLIGYSSSTPPTDYIGLKSYYGSIRMITNVNQEVMRITRNNRVGIGVVAPDNTLDVRLSESSGWLARFAETSGAGLIFGVNPNNDDALSGFIAHTSANRNINYSVTGNGRHQFYTDWGRSMVITSGGKIGIGQPIPEDLVHIRSENPVIRISNSNYHGGGGNAAGTVLGTIKFSNRDDNHNYRAEMRGILTGNWAEYVGLSFTTHSSGQQIERMRIMHDGSVGIGTTNPTALLSVAGKMDAREIKVEVEAGATPDYVFADDYKLSTLEETASYIEENHHLPEISSAKEMEANGMNVGEMNLLLLKKIEELTLHLIEKDRQLDDVIKRLQKLEKQ